MMNARLYTTSMPISDEFKGLIRPVALAIGNDSMERGTGMLLEQALDFYRDVHPEVSSPQTDFFSDYIKLVDECGLYRAVKGNGKKNRSFRISADPQKMIYVARMRNKYMVTNRNRCIRLLLPMGVIIQPFERLDGFTIPQPFDGWFGKIERMIEAARKGRSQAGRSKSD